MELKTKLLRKHFTRYGRSNVLVPKRGFDSAEEVEEKTGFTRNKVIIYDCDVCGKLHISGKDKYRKTPPRQRKGNRLG